MTGALVALGALVVAAAAGLLIKARSGRVRAGRDTAGRDAAGPPAEVLAALDPAAAVTLVQFSTTFCAPCRHTRVLLADLAERTPGLAHADIDLTDRPELARRMAVLRTPTTVAVDPAGAEILRVSGVPRRDELLAALRERLPA
ncbi:thioredoxin family protein [Actinokineospora sp. UTMC 2448]|nr:thioredoxin family protein [Actinokineospora sp. UTMC 2448]UVS82465.1 Thioredoxin [Actinokineospora sp. UTMC 2448]